MSPMPEPIAVKIEKLVYGGDGLGHHDGHTVFVPFVLPEEEVFIEPLESRKKFIRGRIARIGQPSPHRTAPPCPYFGVCGGCHYQHIPYDLQLAYKAEILRETLSRLGRIAWDGPILPHPSPPFGYRNRAQWKITSVEGAAPSIGYFQGRSQRLCPVSQCPIVSPRIAETLAALSSLLGAGKLPPNLREAEAFVDDSDAALLLNLSFERLNAPPTEIAGPLREALPGLETLLLHDQRADRFELVGPGHIVYRVAEHAYRVGHLSFFQVNRFLLPDLVAAVLGEARGKLALDLFAGVGLFTVPLAQRFQRVIGVESNVAAARDLEANLQQSGAPSAALRRADVEAFLARWQETPDLVVLDPPRAGIPAPALARLVKLAPPAIAYLSCDPATLARDLALLVGTQAQPGPYLISEVHLVDIFPQTYHMEALVRLTRRA
jgi:23S rRNA (uracil1939-C5)-methyltransferase